MGDSKLGMQCTAESRDAGVGAGLVRAAGWPVTGSGSAKARHTSGAVARVLEADRLQVQEHMDILL